MKKRASFAEETGYGWHGKDIDTACTEAIGIIGQTLKAGHWVISGATAIAHHAGKAAWRPTQDIDILVTVDQLLLIRSRFTGVSWIEFGLSVAYGSVTVDFQAALKKFQRQAIAEAETVSFADAEIPFLTPPYLLVSNMLAGRRRNIENFLLLAKAAPESLTKARRLCKQFHPDEVEDFDSLRQWAVFWNKQERQYANTH